MKVIASSKERDELSADLELAQQLLYFSKQAVTEDRVDQNLTRIVICRYFARGWEFEGRRTIRREGKSEELLPKTHL